MSPADYAAARVALMKDIVARAARHGTGDGGRTIDPQIIDAMARIPREQFVPMMEQRDAYANRPLPIGHRQTISQPLIVAMMTHHLRPTKAGKVLEIGTGSGYQTAVLAELAGRIVTIENLDILAKEAETRLTDLGYRNIRFVKGDGRAGFAGEAPFDRIIVTAAAEAVPEAFFDQLASKGRMVLPIGGDAGQHLVLITKDEKGHVEEQMLFPVGFVPLTYGHGSD